MPENSLIKSVEFMSSLEGFNKPVELAIIATNADIRRNVILDLMSKSRIKYLILEKVVFPSIADFEEVIPLLNEKNIKAWVNCSRRMYPFFQKLKKRTIKSKKIEIVVEGSFWGLGSNIIHMLDLLAFLTEETKYELDLSKLDQQIYQTKRENFIEFGGEIRAISPRGDNLKLVDMRNNEIPLKMVFKFDGIKIEVDQMSGRICEYRNEQIISEVSNDFQMLLQSELTNIQVDEILETGISQLTKLEESYILHKPILKSFNSYLSKINNKKTLICPIT
jgi:hypothetical protein